MLKTLMLLAAVLPLTLAVYIRFFDVSWQLENLAAFLSVLPIYYASLGIVSLIARKGLLTVVMILTSLSTLVGINGQRFLQSEVCESKTLSVLQYNVFYENTSLDTLITYVREAKPDLVVLQEVTPKHGEQLTSLNNLYPYRFGGQRRIGYPNGLMIMSRSPLYGMNVRTSAAGHSMVNVIWQTRYQRDVFVVAAHPPSPRSEVLWLERNALIQDIGSFVERSPLTFNLVLGDFNLASTTRRFDQTLSDYSTQPVGSWPLFMKRWGMKSYPVAAIDHLWVKNEDVQHSPICSRERVKEIQGSDHAAILTVLNVE
ncbi:endonuclease/exonuclease/phosphatase family protein [Vibrio maritimus]|uniref:endonuclease/exonuclease/phosphatase family protein n=1 Tax=Vibrio maritimus TaxID=990268 RepID=UPI003734ECCA